MSTVPIIADKSAKKCPFTISGSKCKWWYAGDLTLHLYGVFVLSAISDTPNSPFGDSIPWYVQPLFTGKPSLQYLKCFISSSIEVYAPL
jgi:hypothetical protein